MNINDFEKLLKDPVFVDGVARRTFYAIGKARDPHHRAKWADVSEKDKAECSKIGFEAIHALVDDWTTKGCTCKYCIWQPESDKARLIMCTQRWNRLPGATRVEIAESVDD